MIVQFEITSLINASKYQNSMSKTPGNEDDF